jgi:hypothetical protein
MKPITITICVRDEIMDAAKRWLGWNKSTFEKCMSNMMRHHIEHQLIPAIAACREMQRKEMKEIAEEI